MKAIIPALNADCIFDSTLISKAGINTRAIPWLYSAVNTWDCSGVDVWELARFLCSRAFIFSIAQFTHVTHRHRKFLGTRSWIGLHKKRCWSLLYCSSENLVFTPDTKLFHGWPKCLLICNNTRIKDHGWYPWPHSPSVCFLIFKVTVSPAICNKWMASLKGFPFRLLLFIARILSPMWIAPVLQ